MKESDFIKYFTRHFNAIKTVANMRTESTNFKIRKRNFTNFKRQVIFLINFQNCMKTKTEMGEKNSIICY